MTLHEFPDVEQRSDEWFNLRRGIVTASAVGQLVALGAPDPLTVACPTCGARSGPCMSTARKAPTELKSVHPTRTVASKMQQPVIGVADNDTSRALVTNLAIERVNGWSEETPMTADMWRGVEHEPIARDRYNDEHEPATEFGFMLREEEGWSLGLSPDGVVGDDGLIEIKCPRAKAHFRTIVTDRVPSLYMPQCQGALFVSGRAWLDYVSFHAGMPLKVIRVYPDADWFIAIENACRAFEAEVVALIDMYNTAAEGLPATERVLEEEMTL